MRKTRRHQYELLGIRKRQQEFLGQIQKDGFENVTLTEHIKRRRDRQRKPATRQNYANGCRKWGKVWEFAKRHKGEEVLENHARPCPEGKLHIEEQLIPNYFRKLLVIHCCMHWSGRRNDKPSLIPWQINNLRMNKMKWYEFSSPIVD